MEQRPGSAASDPRSAPAARSLSRRSGISDLPSHASIQDSPVQNGTRITAKFASVCDVDLLEVSKSEKYWRQNLHASELAERLRLTMNPYERPKIQEDDQVRLRALFIPKVATGLVIPSDMLKEICSLLPIADFLWDEIFGNHWWTGMGNALFPHLDSAGRLRRLEVYYHYTAGYTNSGDVLFFYDAETRCTTYICFECDDEPKERWVQYILNNYEENQEWAPFQLHIHIATHCIRKWNKSQSLKRMELLDYEKGRIQIQPRQAIKDLHDASQTWNIMLQNLTDFEIRMSFLLEIAETFREIQQVSAMPEQKSAQIRQGHNETQMIIKYLLSKSAHNKRWVSNYRDRTDNRINLVFHLSGQVDNQLNVQISKSTAAIARDAQRDSSAMITIAAVTMFFLPGTFISAIFSMVFFDFQSDENGQETFQVSSRWWYYLVTTIPLTGGVFAVWIIWQRLRYRKRMLVTEGPPVDMTQL